MLSIKDQEEAEFVKRKHFKRAYKQLGSSTGGGLSIVWNKTSSKNYLHDSLKRKNYHLGLLLTPYGETEPHVTFTRILGINGSQKEIHKFTDGTDADYVMNRIALIYGSQWMSDIWRIMHLKSHRQGFCYSFQRHCENFVEAKCKG